MVDSQEVLKHYKTLSLNSLKSLIIKKALLLGLLFGLLMPIVLIELLRFSHTPENLEKYGIVILILVPTISFITFMCFRSVYKCPKCSSKWCYQQVGETVLETYVANTDGADAQNDSKEITIERYILEIECSKCHYKALIPKKRKYNKKR